jgi:hypothetical protein
MLMELIPDAHVKGFEMNELNRFIKGLVPNVYNFWVNLLQIELNDERVQN